MPELLFRFNFGRAIFHQHKCCIVVSHVSRLPIYLKVIVSKAFSGYISRAGAGRSLPFFTHIAWKLITYTKHAASEQPLLFF